MYEFRYFYFGDPTVAQMSTYESIFFSMELTLPSSFSWTPAPFSPITPGIRAKVARCLMTCIWLFCTFKAIWLHSWIIKWHELVILHLRQ